MAGVAGQERAPIMTPRVRRVVQAVLFEALAVVAVTPALAWMFDQPLWTSLGLTLAMSVVALAWNYVFNTVFEAWESKQQTRGRSWRRRAIHGVLFEVGLALWMVPLVIWWMDVSLWKALITDIGLSVFFMVYAMAFTWGFDQVFGLPESARGAAPNPHAD